MLYLHEAARPSGKENEVDSGPDDQTLEGQDGCFQQRGKATASCHQEVAQG